MCRSKIPLQIKKFNFFHCRPQDTLLETIYFWFSLFCLMGRTLLVSLCAAHVHDEAQKPAIIIRAIPYESYDTEVGQIIQLFMKQI